MPLGLGLLGLMKDTDFNAVIGGSKLEAISHSASEIEGGGSGTGDLPSSI